MDTERRMTTQEMLAQHKKLMDEAQRLEPSVMVTEKNWRAMLEMQDRLFRQQMQLDTDLKMLLTKAEAGISDQDANERRKFRETGWEPEREVFFQLQGADRDYEALPNRDPERYEEAAFEYGAGDAEENPDVRVDLDYSADLVRDAVRLGRAVEQMTDDAPTHDGTTMLLHIDSKRRKKLRQKKTALGHAEDDHEDALSSTSTTKLSGWSGYSSRATARMPK